MAQSIEDSLRRLVSSLQLARIYPLEHPKSREALDAAYVSLQGLLSRKEELVIGIVGEELAVENEIFFDLSRTLKPMIQHLKERKIERISFLRQLSREELAGFVEFLSLNKDQPGQDPQDYLAKRNIRNIRVTRLKGSSPEPGGLRESVDYIANYENSLNGVSKSLNNVLNGSILDGDALKATVMGMMENLMGGYNNLLKLTSLKKHDLSTFSHMLDASVLSMHFSSRLGFNKEDVLNIGIAALFHDIGKIYISQKIIKKADKLTDEEFGAIKSHTSFGTEILLNYTKTLGILPAVVCFEHHLRYDLKGYPRQAFPKAQHLFSRIVAICDVYDALNERRSYKKNYPPEMIYNLMQREKGRLFDPALLDSFFKIMGVWPVGTICSLSDKRIAIVRQENEDDIFSPKVEAVFPLEQREEIDLRQKKGDLKIEYALDPAEEGRRFLHLV